MPWQLPTISPRIPSVSSGGVAFAEAVNAARLMDLTTAQPEQVREDIANSYPFHPAIRDLYARFRENTGFQQTRALLLIMRLVVADLWQSGKARRQHLIGAHDVDLHHRDVLSEVRQINATLDNAMPTTWPRKAVARWPNRSTGRTGPMPRMRPS